MHFKVFGFLITQPSFSFFNVKTITILAICSVNNSGFLLTINAVLVRKEIFYASSVLRNDLKVSKRVEFYEDMIDHRSYAHNLSSCEIKA